MNELHLFAGIGGGILGGMLLGHRCVAAVEINPYCRRVLVARQQEGVLDPFPVHDDVKTFDGTAWRGKVDIVCGGFPCQPWSLAGKRLGADDPRHLWPAMARIISEVRPQFVFAENVNPKAFCEPYSDLRAMGYMLAPLLQLSASDVGAPHRRRRYWLLAADANSQQHQGGPSEERGASTKELLADATSLRRAAWRPEPTGEQGRPSVASSSCAVGSTDSVRQLQPQGVESDERRWTGDPSWWATEPNVGRVAHGVPSRVERLRGLGNAQVPACAAQAFRTLHNWLERL